jgi:citrate lyase beta subunit
MIARALTLAADGLILDLEDAVAPDRKEATRPIVRRWLTDLDFGDRERWVRMNPFATGMGRADLAETMAGRPDGYVLPKARHAADVREVAQELDRLEERHGIPNGQTRLVVIATEVPEGLLNIGEIAKASPRIVAISWGIEDLSAAMGLPRTRDAKASISTFRGTPA